MVDGPSRNSSGRPASASLIFVSVFGFCRPSSGSRWIARRRSIVMGNVLVPSLFQTFFFAGSNYVAIYYLPIYFQSIDGVNPTESGVRNLPFIHASSGCHRPFRCEHQRHRCCLHWPLLRPSWRRSRVAFFTSRHRHAQRQVDRLPDLGWVWLGARLPGSHHLRTGQRSPQGYILCDRHHLV